MSINARRALYYIFILAFLLITPTLILYSLGYSFESGLRLQKSGILVINTEPSGASISLNGKKVQKFWGKVMGAENLIRTPAKVKNIKPGKYEVSVSLPGYWPWQKRLEIHPGQTTFAEDIFLFKNNDSVFISDLSELNYFSGDKRSLISISTSSASLLTLEKENSLARIQLSFSADPELKWSPNYKTVLTKNNILKTNDWKRPQLTDSFFGSNYQLAEWVTNDKILYYSQNKLFLFDLKQGSNQELAVSENIISILPRNNKLYIIKKESSRCYLEILDISSNENREIIELPMSDYYFTNTEHTLLNIFDSQHRILYLVDPQATIRPLKETIYGPEQMQWVTQNTLLYSSGFELWLLDLHNYEKKLLTRISDRINNIEWHPSNNYIVFSTENSINILELDSRDKYSITEIARAKKIENMVMDIKGGVLYFISNNGSKKLYKIFIQ